MRSVYLTLACLLACAGSASATVIDFGDVQPGSFGSSFTSGNITFSSPGELLVAQYPTDSGFNKALCSSLPGRLGCEGELTVTFETAVSNFRVTVDGANSTSAQIAAFATLSDDSVQTLSFDGFEPFVAKVLSFGALQQIRSVTFTSSDPQGFSFDDFTFGNAAVPEPSSWAMLILGFGLAGSALRRTRVAAVLA